ncbi:collagen binding domain-containing protein, partial [Virgibacillus alimentarius]
MTKRMSMLFAVVLLFQTIASSLFLPQQAFAESHTENDMEETIFNHLSVVDMEGDQVTEDTEDGSNVQVNINWDTKNKNVKPGDTYLISLPDSVQISDQQEGKLLQEEITVGEYEVSPQGEVLAEMTDAVESYPEANGEITVNAVYVNNQTKDEEVSKEKENSEVENNNEVDEKDKEVSEEKNEATEITKNIITDVSLKQQLEDGTEKDLQPGEEIVVDSPYDAFKVSIQYNLELPKDHEYGAGSTYAIDVPAYFDLKGLPQGPHDLVHEKEEKFGEYVIKNGKVVITFNEEIESNADIRGSINLDTKFDAHYEGPADGETISFPVKDDQSIDFPVQFKPEKENNKSKDEEVSKEKENNEVENNNKIDENDKKASEEKNQENKKKQDKKAETKQNKASEATEITKNIITDVNMKQQLEDGTEKDLQPGEEIVVDSPYDKFKVSIQYDFALPNDHEYGAGSTYAIDVPAYFNLKGLPQGPHDLVNGSGVKFGEYVIKDGKVVITFNEEIERNSDIRGYIKLDTKLDAHYKGPADGETISFPVEDDQSIDFPIKFKPKGKEIDKKGVPNQAYNTKEITWTVDFNKSLEQIDHAVLKDQTSGSQAFVDGSLEVYKIYMNADGTIDESRTEKFADHDFGEDFPLQLGNIDSAYRVVYKTKITDDEGKKYTNTATLDGDNTDPVEASAEVNVRRGSALEKKSIGYVGEDQLITWEVKYNYNEKSITKDKAILTDILGNNQKLVDESFEVYEVNIDPKTGKEKQGDQIEDYKVEKTTDGFQLKFDDDIDKAYKIIYQTKAKDRVEAGDTIENTIKDENGHEKNGKQNVNQQILVKKNFGSNYKDKFTKWRVTINQDEYLMQNVSLVDKLPVGFTPRDIKITHGGQDLTNDTDFNWNFDERTHELKVHFNKAIDKKLVIEYTTDIDFDKAEPNHKKNQFKNHVNMKWTTEDGDSKEKQGSAVFNPGNYTKDNGFKNGSYNPTTKEITWSIGVNYNKKKLDNAVVEDFIQGNQNFNIDSVRVFHMNLKSGNNGIEIGKELTKDEYAIHEAENEKGEKGFRVELGDINTPYYITFTTDLNDTLVYKNYENMATVKSDNNGSYNLKASVQPTNGGSYTDKSVQQDKENGRIAHWNLNINFAQSTVSNVSVTDTPSSNQKILTETIKLYPTKVSADPNKVEIDKGSGPLKEGEDYTLTFEKNEFNDIVSFTLKFTDKKISEAYVLQYDTYIVSNGGDGKIKNQANFEGDETKEVKTDDSVNKKIDVSNIEGGIDGKTGNLEILKVDAETDDPLSDAVFELYNKTKNGTFLISAKSTDQDGKVVFTNLQYGDYILKEKAAPDGYVVGINDQKTVNVDDKVSEVTIKNHQIIYEAQLTKVDAEENKTLKGATFELQQKVDGKFKTMKKGLKTDDKGVIHVEDLEPGEYQFVETKAPEGYLLDGEPIPFTIGEKEIEPVKVTAKNNAIETTAIKGEKHWKDGNSKDRPEMIKVDLLQDDKVYKTTEVTAEDNWKYSFSDLPKTDASGNAYEYSVQEQAVEGYETTIEGSDITNVRTGETNVSVTKTWKDDNAKDRPASITVELVQNGKVIDSKEVTAETDWK